MTIKLSNVECDVDDFDSECLSVSGWYKGAKFAVEIALRDFPAFCAAAVFTDPLFNHPFGAKVTNKEREEIKKQLTRILFDEYVNVSNTGAIIITDNTRHTARSMDARDIRKYVPGFRKFAYFGNPNHGNREVNMWIKVLTPLKIKKSKRGAA